ncbi:MAG TPA: type II secretion system F family protein [Candidatus Sumerlaeota bacterium]|nr:type II secretion system F family protein [Candidatus Sumerlaeota bacterium]HPK03904.1 type II secretion system F family protein [Candidatus Sumerlaeota bacterium]
MPIFSYKAKDRRGEIVAGNLDADSRAAATARLQAMGLFPIAIQGGEERSAAGPSRVKRALKVELRRGGRIRSEDLADFYRQMSDLIGAGVPLVKALGIVKNQTPNSALQGVLSQVSSDVQGGDTFAGALDKHPRTFTRLTVALVRAGETGGLLDETLNRIADYAESQDELRAKVKSALAYPMVMVIVGVIAVVVLLTFVMPKVLTIFDELDQTLPAITQVLIAITEFLPKYWLPIVGGAGVLYVLGRRYIKSPTGALRYHTTLLKVPKLGDLILKREVAAFARTLGSLLRNGVPILNALSIAAEVMTILPVRREIEKIPESITQGAGIAPTLRGSALFPPVVVNMVAIGEETGHLPDVLLRVAESYETQVERSVKTLTSFIEPIIILVLGLVVGFIVMAMLLPIFSIDPTQGTGV